MIAIGQTRISLCQENRLKKIELCSRCELVCNLKLRRKKGEMKKEEEWKEGGGKGLKKDEEKKQ